MRVCLVSPEVAPFHGWGVGAYTAQAARALAAAGHEVHVLTRGEASLRAELERPEAQRLLPGVRFHVIEPLFDV